MSSKSKGGLITLLVICCVIIGFGFYYIFNLQSQINQISSDGDGAGIVNTWHAELLDTIDVNFTYEPIDQLNTTITVNSGEWVYVSFVGNARLNPTDTLRHSLVFYFAIDGDLQAPGAVYEESLGNAGEDDVEWIPVSFYVVFKDIDPGTYIISVYVAVIYNSCPAEIGGINSFFGSSLLVQTLIP
jgi:hypothetical protein